MNGQQRLVDYFVISGLNVESGLEPDQLSGENLHCVPIDRPYKARILAHYPENVPGKNFDEHAVCMLCHPKGLRFCTQRNLDEVTIPYYHSFIITKEDGSRQHGAALTFYEECGNRQICTAMQTLQAMHLAELSNSQSRTLYSHLSESHRRSPLPEEGETSVVEAGQVYDMHKDTLYVTKTICVLSNLPLISTFKKLLRALFDACMKTGELECPMEIYVYNLLYEVPLPPPGRSLKFSTAGCTIISQRPSTAELPLFDHSLRELFSLLSLDNILHTLSTVLLEHQILLYSKDYQKLMLVAEGISALIFPFQWQHVYVPILPASLLHFLDAPVPFVMGLHHSTDGKALLEHCSQANMCFVDIDSGNVELPEDLPTFPYFSELKGDLTQELLRLSTLSDCSNGHQRDSGFIRESFIGPDEGSSSAEGSASSSSWNLSKLEMLQQNEAMAKITALAKRTGVISSLEDISASLGDIGGPFGAKPPTLDEHIKDLMFNSAIREIFLHYFLQIFNSFEAFVIPPSQDMDAWLNNREIMQNFDKAAFLSDHPEAHLPFLSAFIETQMFTTFIDNKIIAQWEEPDPFLVVFEARLRVFRDDQGEQRVRRFYRTGAAKDAEAVIERRGQMVDLIAPPPRPLEGASGSGKHTPGFFPILSADILNKKPASQKQSRREHRWRKKGRSNQHSEHLQLRPDQREKYIQEARSKGVRQPKLSDMNPAAMVHTNWKFVETLLKECKAKTKRMLVEKMGQEAVELGHGEATITGVEENTLIASLCDLLERIWSHGLQQKQGKSTLWSHLLSFQEVEQCNDGNKQIDPNLLTPDYQASWAYMSQISSRSRSANRRQQQQQYMQTGPGTGGMTMDPSDLAAGPPCPSGMQTWPIRRHRRKASRGPELPTLEQLPVSALFDMRNVQNMTEIKTDVGFARAWVRLSLEKKLLSKHLKELLSNPDLLRSLYKRYAFLRCEDEREQFLYHLLSLNAVDYHCFTNTFTTTVIPYRILLFPRQKLSGGTTTANCWLSLAGQLGETEHIPIPKHTLDLTVQHKNLGILTTLRIGHDNAGMSPKWMVEHILVRNEVTGHTYRFPNGRWLGKGVDDGAIERLLVAEPVSASTDANELMEKCRTPPRCRSPSMPRRSNEPRLLISDIQEMLGDAVNNLVKYFYKPEKERGSLTGLLCGEYGLVYCMEHVFQCGFKSARLFRGRFFVWDFLEKVQGYFETLLHDQEHYEIAQDVRRVMETYVHVCTCINAASESIGKDGRFQIFICIGTRDHLLQRWIRIISKTPVTVQMYEEQSFLRDPALVQFLVQILDSLKEFKVILEASLIKGVKL